MSAAFEGCFEEYVSQSPACVFVEEARRHGADVCVVVLTSQTCYLVVPAVGRADCGVLVEGHVDAVAAAAEGYAATDLSCADGRCQRVSIVGVVATFGRMAAEVFDVVAGDHKSRFDGFFHGVACVVARHSDCLFVHFLKCEDLVFAMISSEPKIAFIFGLRVDVGAQIVEISPRSAPRLSYLCGSKSRL